MKTKIKKAIKSLNNRNSILSFSLLLFASLFIHHASCAASENKRDSLAAILSKGENLSVTFSASSGKAILKWRNNRDINTSHYVLQRSINGINYDDAAVIIVPEDEANTIERFKYSDKINVGENSFIYYRLKIVDDKGEVKYSKVVILELDYVENKLA